MMLCRADFESFSQTSSVQPRRTQRSVILALAGAMVRHPLCIREVRCSSWRADHPLTFPTAQSR